MQSNNFKTATAIYPLQSLVGKLLFVGSTDGARLHWYEEKLDGYFEKLGDPDVSLPGTTRGISVNPQGTLLAVAHDSSPFISVYRINKVARTLTKLPNLPTLPTANARACHFSPDGQFLIVGFDATPFLRLYSVSGENFTNLPAPTAAANPFFVQWNRTSDAVAVACSTSPFAFVFTRSGNTLTSRTLPSMDTSSLAGFNGCSWSPDNKVVFTGNGTSAVAIQAWSLAGTTLTRIPSAAIAGCYSNARQCQFSAGGGILLVGESNSPRLTMRLVSGIGFVDPKIHNTNIPSGQVTAGANASILSTEPNSTLSAQKMSHDGKYVACVSAGATNDKNLLIGRFSNLSVDEIPLAGRVVGVCVDWWPRAEDLF